MSGRMDRLTDRQKQILDLVAQNYTSKEIGRVLGISPSTVDNHALAAMQTLGAASRAEAARFVADNWHRQKLPRQSPDLPPTTDPAMLDPSAPSDGKTGSGPLFALPPIGGQPNDLSWSQKSVRILQIAAMSLVTVTAFALVIAGALESFS